jgi:hypothetical protein
VPRRRSVQSRRRRRRVGSRDRRSWYPAAARNRLPPSALSCGESRCLCPADARPLRSSRARSLSPHAARPFGISVRLLLATSLAGPTMGADIAVLRGGPGEGYAARIRAGGCRDWKIPPWASPSFRNENGDEVLGVLMAGARAGKRRSPENRRVWRIAVSETWRFMQNLAGISGRQVRAWQADGCGLSGDITQKGTSQEDKHSGRHHDREDFFPGVNNSSYRYTKSSSGKKFTRKPSRKIGHFSYCGQPGGRSFA